MIVFKRKTMFIILVVVICACLYDHVSAANRPRHINHSELAKALMNASKAVQQNDFLFGPFRLIFRLINFLFRAVTYPIRFVYRLIFNFIAVFALLMQGCRIIPETSCPNRRVQDVADEILAGIREELEFLATMDANA